MSQYLATTKRVCTYDPPGTGWSSEIRSDTFAYEADLFASVVQLSNEILPIDLIGWVGGGQVILKYNSKYPQNVKSLIFQSAYPPEIEFIYSDASTSKRASELNARKSITSILLGLAIPWGLMPIFISGNQSSYVPQDRYWEYRVQLWKSKTWKGQGDGLDYMIANDGRNDLAYYNNVSAPLTAIVCGNFGACQSWQSSSDCVKANTSFQFYLNQSLVWYQKLQPTVKVIYNPDPVCRTNLEWFDPYIANITAGILS